MENISAKEIFTIEVEYNDKNLSIEIYNSIIKTITEVNGLQLLLITGDDKLSIQERNMINYQLSISYVLSCRNHVSKLVSTGEYRSAFLSLWLFAELLMERLTKQTPIPTKNISSILMIHHLYQQSIISVEQFETAIYLNSLQNRLSKKYFKNRDIQQDLVRLWDLVDDFLALEIQAMRSSR